MKKFSAEEKAAALREWEEGRSPSVIAHDLGVSIPALYAWKKRYGPNAEESASVAMRVVKEQNRRLKKVVHDLSLENAVLQELLRRKS